MLIVSLILGGSAVAVGALRTEGECSVVSNSRSKSRVKIEVGLNLGNDNRVQSVYEKAFASPDEAQAVMNQYRIGEKYGCAYNRWVTGQVVLGAGELPTRLYFWELIAAAIFMVGLGLSKLHIRSGWLRMAVVLATLILRRP